MVVVASGARRWAWLVAASLCAVVAGGWLLLALAAANVGLTFLAVSRCGRQGWIGAASAVGVVFVVFRLPSSGFFGLQTILAIAVVAPLVVSGLVSGRSSVRRAAAWIGAIGVLGVVAMAITTAVAVAAARGHVVRALDQADAAQDAVADNDDDTARELLRAATGELDAARDAVDSPWVRPARSLPVLGQHVRLLSGLLGEALTVSGSASAVIDSLDLDRLGLEGGRVDLDAVGALAGPAADFASVASESADDIDTLRSPWLVAPVADRVSEVYEEVEGLVETSADLATVARVAPPMLGADGDRSYLVLFVTPAESRAAGGFVGNWVLLRATDGRLQVDEVGRSSDLNELLRTREVPLTAPEEYVARYGPSRPERFFQDVTLSPDVPVVAQVAADLFTAATDRRVDGVVLADPDALASLLAISGPVEIDDVTLDEDTASDFLLREQYAAFPTERERLGFLDELVETVFTRLVGNDLPDPAELADVLRSAVREDRLTLWSAVAEEQADLASLGIDGGFPSPTDGGDLVGLVTQNLGQNKIDVFLERSLSYDVEWSGGVARSTATIELRNAAPSSGLPDAVIGNNDQGLPFGTNVVNLTLYSPLDLVTASLGGAPVALQRLPELGVQAYATTVTLGPGDTAVLTIELTGPVALVDGSYHLAIAHQPTVNDDQVDVRISVGSSEAVGESFVLTDDRVVVAGSEQESERE